VTLSSFWTGNFLGLIWSVGSRLKLDLRTRYVKPGYSSYSVDVYLQEQLGKLGLKCVNFNCCCEYMLEITTYRVSELGMTRKESAYYRSRISICRIGIYRRTICRIRMCRIRICRFSSLSQKSHYQIDFCSSCWILEIFKKFAEC
jgi:hypothetical protein